MTETSERDRIIILETTQKLFMEENNKQHQAIMTSMTDFHVATKETLKNLEDKLDKALEKKADKSVVDSMRENISSIEGNFRWVTYTVVGAMIVGIIGFVFFK